MKINTRVFDGLEGYEPFEVQEIKEGVTMELYYMNDTPYLDEFTKKGNFAAFCTRKGDKYKLLIEKGYYEVMKDFYDLETNRIWEQFWCDVDKCRRGFMLKLMLPILLVYLVVSYIVIAVSGGSIFALLGCVFALFLVTYILGAKNKADIHRINYEAGNKIRELKGAKRFDELAKEQERYYAKYFGYEEEYNAKQEELAKAALEAEQEIVDADNDDEIERIVEQNEEDVIENNEETNENDEENIDEVKEV